MKKLILLIVLFISFQLLNAQGPPQVSNWIVLTSQNEVDSFPITHPIDGVLDTNLAIAGEDITNVDSLASIVIINGHLVVGGGISPIYGVPGFIGSGNPLLNDISGLANLDSINGSFFIKNNPSISSIVYLSGLDFVMGDLVIDENDELINLDGLEGLEKVGHWLSISSNHLLEDLDGLLNVNEADYFVYIDSNANLTSINGLSGIDPASIFALRISGNTSLSNCAIEPVCNILDADSIYTFIENNAVGCNSPLEVQSQCNACPENLFFSEQWEVDSFPIWYPDCYDIPGNVNFSYYTGDNLDSLYQLESIGGRLSFGTTWLENVDGLSNLESVDELFIHINSHLENLDGLSGLQGHIDYLLMGNNELFNNFEGLEGITSIGLLSIGISTENFQGLTNVISIDNLSISSANDLVDFQGLDALTYINGEIWIYDNNLLSSIVGLQNVSVNDTSEVHIFNNPLLEVCNVPFVCSMAINQPENLEIDNNAPGCNSIEEVLDACNICPNNFVYVFTSQAQIDSFPSYYPTCTQFEGWLWISGEDITNLDSLIQLTSVGLLDIGAFDIGNPLMENIDGLSNLTDIGGYLGFVENDLISTLEPLSNVTSFTNLIIIDNDNLESLEGLENVGSAEQVIIRSNDALEDLAELQNLYEVSGFFAIEENSALTSLSGLENLESVSNYFWINGNDNLEDLDEFLNLDSVDANIKIINNAALANLNGLENVDPILVDSLFIINNSTLSWCNNSFVCEFLVADSNLAVIEANDVECSTISEVLLTCGIGVGMEELSNDQISVYPIPVKDILYITSDDLAIQNIQMYNQLGQSMPISNTNAINVSSFPKGVYLVVVETASGVLRKRLVVE